MTKKIITHRESFVSGFQKIYDDAHGRIGRNLIHLVEDEIETPIYRIISFDRLKDILTNKQLGLVRPKKWDDPFENWLLKSNFILKDGSKASIMSSHEFIGQCWSLTEESDAMWRIYSRKKNGVKIKTTIRKLLESLINDTTNNSKYEITKFIGRVKYLSKDEIIYELQKNAQDYSTTNIGQAKSHFFKRPEFTHENEVRILFKTNQNTNNDIFNLKIEPNDLIEEIILDPRLKSLRNIKNKTQEIKDLGFLNTVKQSTLYQFEDISIDLNL